MCERWDEIEMRMCATLYSDAVVQPPRWGQAGELATLHRHIIVYTSQLQVTQGGQQIPEIYMKNVTSVNHWSPASGLMSQVSLLLETWTWLYYRPRNCK